MKRPFENEAQEILADYRRISGDRGTTEAHWEEIAARCIPSHKGLFTNGTGFLGSKGDKRTEELFDSTAAVALSRFAAILDSLLTPRNQTWHRIRASDPFLNKNRDVKLWFEEVNRLLFKYRYAPMANFSAQNQMNYVSLGAYGSGCVFVDKLRGRKNEAGLRYRNIHLGEIFFVENHQGIVDKAYRYYPMTCRQAMQKWGKDQLPEKMRNCINPEEIFFFIHCVKPQDDYDPKRYDVKGMEYGSYEVSVDGAAMMLNQKGESDGYSSFPYAISRYEQTPNEVYGRSPAMGVLPAIKTLNEEKKTLLKQGHRAVDPVLLAFDDGVMDTIHQKPGYTNWGGVNADGRPLVHALPVGNVNVGKDLMDDERNLINDAFLITIFQILTETPQMSATEVLERSKEKGILLAPTIGRQQSEYLGPMIERELDVLSAQRLLPPMPRMLLQAHGDYHIEYDSPLSRAQRAEEASGLARTLETALQVINITQNPEPLDYLNFDVAMPEIAEIQGVPFRWLKSEDQVLLLRAQRAQQQQISQAITAAPGAAALAKAAAVTQQAGAK